MKIYIRPIFAMACLIIGTSTFANGYKDETPALNPVTIPQLKGGVIIGLSALYMTPSSSNLDYLTVNSLLTPTFSNQYNLNYEVSPNYNWGFIFDLGYVYPNTAHDIRFNWMAFHSNYSNQHRAAGKDGVITTVAFRPTGSEELLAITDFAKAVGTINYKLDALDITLGQYLTLFKRLQARVFSGLRYARIDSDMTTSYTATWDTTFPTASSGIFLGNMNSSFNGVGPMIGTRVDLDLGKGLGLAGSIDMALLASQINLTSTQIIHEGTSDGTETIFRNALTWGGTRQIVASAFDAKFGLNYLYEFSNGIRLTGELGYQVSEYFDVIKQMERGPVFGGVGMMTSSTRFLEASIFSTDITNFELRGPYLTLMIQI